ncbi:hypothetical protein HY641_04065, partial [Candidatus Woesearchaeota archaeon]|nr:hypothetical protein [Candidatus Woesearchaeota archaeon]
LMHNKFCVKGDQVITGSHNPTLNNNQDHMILIRSSFVAKNYQREFDELWSGVYGRGQSVPYPRVNVGNIMIETYFCPEDDCEDRVVAVLRSANHSIDVMAFSFTSDPLGRILVAQHKRGRIVRSITDKTQLTQYSEDFALNRSGIPIKIYKSRYRNLLHHKVFIIDNRIVVAGSANPTYSGYHKNDENILIIHSPKIADQFTQEFERIWGES